MKLLEEIKVSVYENVFSKKPKLMSFIEVIFMCIHPTYASIINTIRRYHEEGDHEAAQKMKSKLPCFTPAGTFDGAHAIKNFVTPSCIMGLDYDDVPNRLEVIKKCAEDPHTVAALESPTNGVKVFAYIENVEGRHREGQQLVSRYYDRLLGLQSDPACKDESRLCYFTYSPNGYVASLYETFILPPAPTIIASPEKPGKAQATETLQPETPPQQPSEEETKQFLSSYIFLNPLTKGKRHSNTFKLACEACRRGYSQESILRGLNVFFEHTDFRKTEVSKAVQDGYQTVKSSGTDSPVPSSASSESVKVSKVPYGTFENANEPEETYWQGEEFRKKTPCFPKEVFKNLPNLLDECLFEDTDEREQDISLLSALTALSAVLPYTFGIYNHKKYSPHIFSFVTAPAGSGKSIAQIGRYLLEEIHTGILNQSKSLLQNYDQAHHKWIQSFGKKNKTNEKIEKEPQKPPFKMLIIPASTSYTRMQIQMQDNGTQGSIIFDTEAETLSTANHLDCGNFDDMLRKAFEHENIDSSYKANGTAPIYIRHPQLAIFLTGTPGQVEGLLNSSENGLASRILHYTFRGIPHWKEMGDDSTSLEDLFKPLARRVSELYDFCLNNPVIFHFSPSQWHKLNTTFSQLLNEVALEGNDDLQAVVKRYAFLVMRISMIQTRIRQFETHAIVQSIHCSDIDFERSLSIVLCCYEHSRLLLSSMPSPALRPLKNPDITKNFISSLPENFTTEEAIRAGANFDFSRSKVLRLLRTLNGLKINKVSHGSYTKLNDK